METFKDSLDRDIKKTNQHEKDTYSVYVEGVLKFTVVVPENTPLEKVLYTIEAMI